MERPALQGLLADIRAGRIDILVIYKVDRLTQSLANFARLVEIFDAQDATFVPLRSSSIRRANPGLVKAASHQFHALLQSTWHCRRRAAMQRRARRRVVSCRYGGELT